MGDRLSLLKKACAHWQAFYDATAAIGRALQEENTRQLLPLLARRAEHQQALALLPPLGNNTEPDCPQATILQKTIRDLVKTAQRVDQVNRRLLCDQYQRRQREIAALPAKRQALQRYAGKDLGIFVDHSR
ncbi:MAG TPA: hypothetical protein GXZ96_00935 [Firmicutes bacterium]|jgi:hypothetical protein|nr:hypothetical protein [Bacillota bacterium]